MYYVDPTRRLVTATVGLIIAGILFFLYGMFVTVPEIFSFILSASLIGGGTTSSVIGIDPAGARGAFLLGSLLMILGAAIDVWRRLHVE